MPSLEEPHSTAQTRRVRPSASAAASESAWSSIAERGSALGLRFMVLCYRGVGRRLSGWLLYPIVAYFVAAHPVARRASLDYLRRLRDAHPEAVGVPRREPRWRDVMHHFHTFAELILDRFCFWAGRYDDFDVCVHGVECVTEHLDKGRGVVLLSAHLGSFDLLRVVARADKVAVNAVVFTSNAELINATFKRLDPHCDVRVIEMDPSSIRSAFEIKRCIDRGEIVALLGDRTGPLGGRRVARVPFLGADAAFPQGPFMLPLLFGTPVVLSLALRSGPRTYDVHFETLADGERIAAANRPAAARELATRFAQRLESHCARAPFQWFNFYDFWDTAEVRSEPHPRRSNGSAASSPAASSQ
ncbi:MAG: hypothetical protein VYE73_00685 [Acidobacteriota bacterium]|nr:hypothetical protein [Acidobacteriota bacterium]